MIRLMTAFTHRWRMLFWGLWLVVGLLAWHPISSAHLVYQTPPTISTTISGAAPVRREAQGMTGLGAGAVARAPQEDPCSVWSLNIQDCLTQVITGEAQQIVKGLDPLIQPAIESQYDPIFSTPICVVSDAESNYCTPSSIDKTLQANFEATNWGVGTIWLTFLVAVGGLLILFGRFFGLPPITVSETLPRLALAFLAAIMSFTIVQWLIDLNNVLCLTLFNSGAIQTIADLLQAGPTSFLQVLLMIVMLIAAFFLLGQMTMRFVFLIVLVALSPVGFLCFGLPVTTPVARWWFTTLFTTLFAQVVQVLALVLGGMILGEVGNSLSPLYLSYLPNGIISLFVGIGLLVLTFQIPGKLSRWMQSSGSGSGSARQVLSELIALAAA